MYLIEFYVFPFFVLKICICRVLLPCTASQVKYPSCIQLMSTAVLGFTARILVQCCLWPVTPQLTHFSSELSLDHLHHIRIVCSEATAALRIIATIGCSHCTHMHNAPLLYGLSFHPHMLGNRSSFRGTEKFRCIHQLGKMLPEPNVV